MFTRIVKMEFKTEEIEAFLTNFEVVKEKIRNFPGCLFLELYRNKSNSDVFFTYSRWENESDLENYRNSELFKGVWATTKPKFRSKSASLECGYFTSFGIEDELEVEDELEIENKYKIK